MGRGKTVFIHLLLADRFSASLMKTILYNIMYILCYIGYTSVIPRVYTTLYSPSGAPKNGRRGCATEEKINFLLSTRHWFSLVRRRPPVTTDVDRPRAWPPSPQLTQEIWRRVYDTLYCWPATNIRAHEFIKIPQQTNNNNKNKLSFRHLSTYKIDFIGLGTLLLLSIFY